MGAFASFLGRNYLPARGGFDMCEHTDKRLRKHLVRESYDKELNRNILCPYIESNFIFELISEKRVDIRKKSIYFKDRLGGSTSGT